jgi:hypothetical protein
MTCKTKGILEKAVDVDDTKDYTTNDEFATNI